MSRRASRPRPLQEPSSTHHARAPACSGAPLVPSPSFSTSSPPHVVGTCLGQAYENLKWSGVCRVPALSCSWPTGPMSLLPPVPVSPSAYVLESSEGLPSETTVVPRVRSLYDIRRYGCFLATGSFASALRSDNTAMPEPPSEARAPAKPRPTLYHMRPCLHPNACSDVLQPWPSKMFPFATLAPPNPPHGCGTTLPVSPRVVHPRASVVYALLARTRPAR